MWKILQEKMYKTRIADLELSTTPLMNGCCNDDMIQPLRSQSLFQFVQISDVVFCATLLAIVSIRCKQPDSNLANLGATAKV